MSNLVIVLLFGVYMACIHNETLNLGAAIGYTAAILVALLLDMRNKSYK
jgi:hypothetical protein